MSDPDVSSAKWERLHPLSPLVRGGRILPAIALGLILASPKKHHSGDPTVNILLGVAAFAVIMGFIHWLVTKWRLDGQTLQVETGLLRRDAGRYPVARIQAVDVVRPFAARIFGMAEVRVRMAGSGSGEARIAYVSDSVAENLKTRLLALHHRVDESVPDPPEIRIVSVQPKRLIISILLSGFGLLVVAVGLVFLVLNELSPGAAIAVASLIAAYAFPFLRSVVARLTSEYGFVAATAADGVRIRRGLFETVSETIPVARVQSVRQIEPLLWRPLGWCRLEVDIAGSSGKGQRGSGGSKIRKALLPVGTHEEAQALIGQVLGTAFPVPSRAPARARWKSPFSYHFLAAGHDDTFAVAITGRLTKFTTVMPLAKVQSVRRVEGPVQRRLGLATIYLDAAGRRVRARFKDRTGADTADLIDELARLSRCARQVEALPVAPAAWYRDPTKRHQLRWWDARQWTDDVSDHNELSRDPLVVPVTVDGVVDEPQGPG